MLSKSELARLYGMSLPTFRKKIQGVFEKGKRKFNAADVEIIMKLLGPPKGNQSSQKMQQKEVGSNNNTEALNVQPLAKNDDILRLIMQLSEEDKELVIGLVRRLLRKA
jgi:hypothetical protein